MSSAARSLTISAGISPGPTWREAGRAPFSRVAALLLRWSERAAQRRHLAGLTPRELDDVGIGAASAAAEAAKPFWRA